MAKALVVLGSLNADLYVQVDALPKPGETISGTDAAVRPGGKGANQAAAAGRLGQPTQMIGQVGSDVHGPALKNALAGCGVDTALVRQVTGPSGQAFIILQSGGENSIIIVGGANQAWAATLDTVVRAAIGGAACLLLQGEVPPQVNLAAAQVAHAAGVPVILDAGGSAKPFAPELLALVTIFSPNETELERLSGKICHTQAQVVLAARHVQQQGVGSLLVKLGARGCLLVPPGGAEPLAMPAFAVPVVDSTGAGDCFTAAYAVARLRFDSEQARLRYACAAAALCVQKMGALPSMPSATEVDAFLAKQKA